MEEIVTAILVVSAVALAIALVIPRLDATVDEIFEALW